MLICLYTTNDHVVMESPVHGIHFLHLLVCHGPHEVFELPSPPESEALLSLLSASYVSEYERLEEPPICS